MKVNRIQKAKGFTILELMVVIVIIGLIGAIVVPNIMDNQEKAMMQKAVSDINALETSLKMYKLDNFVYPTTEQGIEALVSKTDIDPIPRRFPDEGYLPRMPTDPWKNDYQLLNPGEHGRIDVFSMGPDGQPGTDDDIGNWNLEEFQ